MDRAAPIDSFDIESESGTEQANLVAWRAAVREIFDIEPVERPFRASLHSYSLGEVLFGETCATGQTFTRDPAVVARSGLDHIFIQIYTLGGYKGTAGGQPIEVREGELSFLDLGSTFETRAPTFGNLNLIVPRALLGLRPHDVSLHGHVLGANRPATVLLTAYLQSLAQLCRDAGKADSDEIGATTLAIVRSVVNGIREADLVAAPAPDNASPLGRICEYIAQEYADPALKAERLCDQFGLSRASLYRMFDPLGGVATYIRNVRLDRGFAMLENPDYRTLRIAALSRRCGFGSADSFARAFQERYGLKPMELRRRLQMHRSLASKRGEKSFENTLSRWLHEVGEG